MNLRPLTYEKRRELHLIWKAIADIAWPVEPVPASMDAKVRALK